jgi:DNA-binding SARP family transcriptional activator
MQNLEIQEVDNANNLQLRLFGSPSIVLDGELLTSIKSAKAQGLLYYLAVTQQSHTRLSLATLLWGEFPDSAARGNLRKALQPLRKYLGDFLTIERSSLTIHEETDTWVDVVEFEHLLQITQGKSAPDYLQQAIDLYKGDFLDGFYLHNAPEFENWWLSKRASLREKMLNALHILADQRAQQGHLDQAIALTRRYLELEPWREGAHRRLMDLLARNGQRSAALAQYELCCQILANELAVEPSQATINLYEDIQTGTFHIPDKASAPPLPITIKPKSGMFLQTTDEVLDQAPLFVGRKTELDQLSSILDRCLEGHGQFVFISGEPGLGKTTLMTAFARQALVDHNELVVAQGNCSAFSGQDDPYLPFRELLSQLTGDIVGQFSPLPFASNQAQRLLSIAPISMQQLIENGSFLVNTLIPSGPLLDRARHFSQDDRTWFRNFQDFINNPIVQEIDLQQSVVFEQVSSLLHTLSKDHPLLILLDDLQWVDRGSLQLFAHLGRRLTSNRVMFLGTYRPEEVHLIPESEQQSLVQVINEFQRRYGEVIIELVVGEENTSRDFVDSILDSQPNDYNQEFRAQFHNRTQGHPLFTVELLRSMQSRGDLLQDPDRGWVPFTQLDWAHIPARVEAMIADRASRLDDRLFNLLALASIQGEIFTAQVITQVEGLSERTLLKDIARELIQQHRLLQEDGETEIQGRYLSRYRFTHALFQEYFYNELSAGERRLLHAEVASALEGLYKNQVDEIAASLAQHYREAHNHKKAATYLQIAGDRAVQLFGYEEACNLFLNALSTLQELPKTQDTEKLQLQLNLKLGEACFLAGQYTESLNAYQRAADLAKNLDFTEEFAVAALGYENSRWRFNLPIGSSLTLLEDALEMLGKEDDSILRARVWTSLVRVRRIIEPPETIYFITQQAVEIARRVGDPQALYEALYLVIWGDRRPENSERRLSALEEMQSLAETMGDLLREQDVNGYRVREYLECADHVNSEYYIKQHKNLADKLQQPFYIWTHRMLEVLLLIMKGQFDQAEKQALDTLQYGQVFSIASIEGIFGLQMFTIRREQGRLKELIPILEAFMAQRSAGQTWRPGLALLYYELERKDEAASIFYELARNDFGIIPTDSMWLTSLSYLSEVCAYLGDQEYAQVLYDLLKPYDGRTFFAGFLEVNFGATARFLGLLAMTTGHWEAAERHLQDALDLNRRMEAWTWLAHSKYLYAVLLITRPEAIRHPNDGQMAYTLLDEVVKTTQDLGMTALEIKAKFLIKNKKGV